MIDQGMTDQDKEVRQENDGMADGNDPEPNQTLSFHTPFNTLSTHNLKKELARQ